MDETLNMMSLEEFVRTMLTKKRYPIESLNSFMYWMKKNGCPKGWPFAMWTEKFDEFVNRKVS